MIRTLLAKRTQLLINYQGKDISQDLAPFLLAFSFTDNSGGKSDDLSLTLQDASGLWLNNWSPSKSDTISASIISLDNNKTLSLPCGTFSVDQIDYSYPPATLNIKAVSSSVNKSASHEKHSHSWENSSLREIASDLAAKNGLALFMKSEGSGKFKRIDQVEQSDLEFLKILCDNLGQECKIQNGQIVIYDIAEFENRDAVTSLRIDDERLQSIRFSSKSAKVYRKAKVQYHDAASDETFEAEYEDDDEEGSERELVIRERVESKEQAENLARNRLLDANRGEVTGSLTLTGDVRLAAGVVIELEEFGMFSGKYFITKATHKVDRSGYTVSLELEMPKAEKGKAKSRKKKAQSKGNNSTTQYYEGEEHY